MSTDTPVSLSLCSHYFHFQCTAIIFTFYVHCPLSLSICSHQNHFHCFMFRHKIHFLCTFIRVTVLCSGTRSAWCWCWPSPPCCPSSPSFSLTQRHFTIIRLPLCLKDLGLLVSTKFKTLFTYYPSSPTPLLNSLQSKYSNVHNFQFLVSIFLRHLIVVNLPARHPLRNWHVSVDFFSAGHFIAICLIAHPVIEQFMLVNHSTSQKLVEVVAGELVELTPDIFIVLELFMSSALLSLANIFRISNLYLLFSLHYFWPGGIFLHDAKEFDFILWYIFYWFKHNILFETEQII